MAEDLLFRRAKQVVFASATVNMKTLELLGVRKEQVRVIEQESNFPVRNRPIYYCPVARVGREMGELDRRRLHDAIDATIQTRAVDRGMKGIVQTVSYRFAREILERSKYRHENLFILDESGMSTSAKVEDYRRRRGAAVLLSPAVQEGLNFPGAECEFQILPKMPFPDMSDPLIQAKKKVDKDYIPYVVLQTVVQCTGRHVRSEVDRGETWILDGHYTWLSGGYYRYLPRWFTSAIKTLPMRIGVEDLPEPLDKIRG